MRLDKIIFSIITDRKINHVFIEKAKKENSPLLFADQEYSACKNGESAWSFSRCEKPLYNNIIPGLKGNYQQKNFLTVIAAVDILKNKLKISDAAVEEGLSKVNEITGLQGRWQQLSENPKIICDTGHNEAGIQWVTEQLNKEKFEKLHIVFGMVNDKDINTVLSLLPKNAIYYFTKAPIERALDETILQNKAKDYGLKGQTFNSVKAAFDAAKKTAGKNDFIFVGGSTFVVAEVI